MSDLVPRRPHSREDRRLGRELARLDADARVSIAYVEQEANVQTAACMAWVTWASRRCTRRPS